MKQDLILNNFQFLSYNKYFYLFEDKAFFGQNIDLLEGIKL
jgi:hypothetical protein